ncbi:type II toxin-antitoxin system HicB family antitoxin [Limnoraphis robusta Tam1]|jgi:predicted RNase H-like HicB family nuclease|uniref:type II toxin-antitoxin system HicB family antitoxin n=1 Tax=Limnoraphis robusta TaxID=1118279 RepID=UPI002B1EDC1B|nr:type II toxin-antitoxin system HicB family antitoxin [Limnoraphis robusta]MEA5499435.1 type II toxin-antitoxin system HicB family antitoxin [Limnoraphis robusta BA-68 BA1]MEA5541820.1 type II toxin-antitoxin system HicB family antitoxin [Limnoraphis robusta Tam1]
MNFYTVVLRKSQDYWVSLSLENGLVGQGETPQEAIDKLKEAIASFEEACQSENNVYSSPISIQELHEFLTLEDTEPSTEIYELRKVYA